MPIPEYKKLRSSFHNKEILTSVILKIFNCYNEIGLVPQGEIIPLSEIYDFGTGTAGRTIQADVIACIEVRS